MPRLESERLAHQADRRAQRRVLETQPLPHSWCLRDWPAWVYPGRLSAARNLVRVHREELIKCGALTRIDRRLTVLGAGYAVFLASKMPRVESYTNPVNFKPRERVQAVPV
jgi:hypothetical protein